MEIKIHPSVRLANSPGRTLKNEKKKKALPVIDDDLQCPCTAFDCFSLDHGCR